MSAIPANPQREAQIRLDQIEYHVDELKKVVLDGSLLRDSAEQTSQRSAEESFEDAVVLAFGHWALGFLGVDHGDASVQVKTARRVLEQLDLGSTDEPDAEDAPAFIDIFAETDLEAPVPELGPDPVETSV